MLRYYPIDDHTTFELGLHGAVQCRKPLLYSRSRWLSKSHRLKSKRNRALARFAIRGIRRAILSRGESIGGFQQDIFRPSTEDVRSLRHGRKNLRVPV